MRDEGARVGCPAAPGPKGVFQSGEGAGPAREVDGGPVPSADPLRRLTVHVEAAYPSPTVSAIPKTAMPIFPGPPANLAWTAEA